MKAQIVRKLKEIVQICSLRARTSKGNKYTHDDHLMNNEPLEILIRSQMF